LTPLLLISGFLGAGKTSLLRELLPRLEAGGATPHVILNDHQNARIDASSLRAPGRAIQPLTGSCVCCDSLASLREALGAMPEGPRQIVLLEASGTSDPGTLLVQLATSPEVRGRFGPLLQVTMVNTQRWQRRFWHNELERLQVRTASHLVTTWLDRVDEARHRHVLESLQQLNPRAMQTNSASLGTLLLHHVRAPAPPAEPPTATRGGKPSYLSMSPDHGLAHDFVATTVDLPPVVDRDRLLAWVDSFPPEVLRCKGIACLHDTPGAEFLVEKTDDHKWGATALMLQQHSGLTPSLVIIGVKLDRREFQAQAAMLA